MLKVLAPGEEGVAVSCSIGTSRSDGSHTPPVAQKGGKKDQGSYMQNTNSATNHHMVKLPPISSRQTSKPSMKSAGLNRTRELKNEVCNLQQQLCESRTENKLLKRVQHRHMMALQQFQDPEDSISQNVTKHKNEVRVLQELLRNTRTSRDNLARQLQATEDKLMHQKETLQQLQLLIRDQNLLEREELAVRLAKAEAEVEEKDKKILDMEKSLELCRASFKQQMVVKQRKLKEAKKISTYLQGQINQLTYDLASREREMEKHNIYSHRFLKGSSNRGRENKMVQTDGLVPLPADGPSLLENEYSEPVQRLEQQESSVNWCGYGPVQESLVIKDLERNTQISANISRKNSSSDKSPEPQNEEKEAAESTCVFNASEPTVEYFSDTCSDESPENKNNGDRVKEKKASEVLHMFEEKRETEHKSTRAFILEQSLKPAPPERKEFRFPRFRRRTLKQTTENLQNGRPT